MEFLTYTNTAKATESGDRIRWNQSSQECNRCSVTPTLFRLLSSPFLAPFDISSQQCSIFNSRSATEQFFSQIPNRVNVKMEDFTWGWCPVLTEDLPAAVSDMEWSVNGWRAVSIKRYACEVQRQGWDKMQDNLRALKSRLINVWFIAVCVSTCVCHCLFLLVSRMNEQRHVLLFKQHFFFFCCFFIEVPCIRWHGSLVRVLCLRMYVCWCASWTCEVGCMVMD